MTNQEKKTLPDTAVSGEKNNLRCALKTMFFSMHFFTLDNNMTE